jgi:hypothetical protein
MGQLNIELLKKVRDKIATTPEAYDQETWGRVEEAAPCGTAACIAGWTITLDEKIPLGKLHCLGRSGDFLVANEYLHVNDVARDSLGLTDQEADILFTSEPGGEWEDYDGNGEGVYGGGWPEPFASQWRNGSEYERPQIAIAYLDHIIFTGKVLE